MKNTILDLDKQFLNLKGEPLNEKMDDVLAGQLALANTGDPNTMVKWATSLVNDGLIEANEEDLKYLRNFIRNRKNLTNLAKAQLDNEIEKALKKLIDN